MTPTPGVRLGRIAGAPVIVTPSWFIIAAVVVFMFTPSIAEAVPGLPLWGAVSTAVGYAVLLGASILLHEAAHAWAGARFGWRTREIVISLLGGHTQYHDQDTSPGRNAAVALSGPLANLALAALAWGTASMLTSPVPYLLIASLAWSNLCVGVFNLLPALPLDGGRILESAVAAATGKPEKGTIVAAWGGRVLAVGLVVWVLLVPLFQGVQPSLTTGMLSVLVAGFLWSGASQSLAHGKVSQRVPTVSARALQRRLPALDMGATCLDAAGILGGGPDDDGPVLIVTGARKPRGYVTGAALRAVPGPLAGSTTLDALLTAVPEHSAVPSAASGQPLLMLLARLPGSTHFVMDTLGRPTGLLFQQDVIAALNGKIQQPRDTTEGNTSA